jgi:ankyrin repeat protein
MIRCGRRLRGFALALVLCAPAATGAQAMSRFTTPLHWAAANGQTALADSLIANGASVKGVDLWGRTPLHVAVRYVDVVKLLLSKGADVNAQDSFLNTPLHLAVLNRDVVEALIAAGADVNARNTFGYTPLDLCLRRGDSPYNISVAQVLVKAGAGKPTQSR